MMKKKYNDKKDMTKRWSRRSLRKGFKMENWWKKEINKWLKTVKGFHDICSHVTFACRSSDRSQESSPPFGTGVCVCVCVCLSRSRSRFYPSLFPNPTNWIVNREPGVDIFLIKPPSIGLDSCQSRWQDCPLQCLRLWSSHIKPTFRPKITTIKTNSAGGE